MSYTYSQRKRADRGNAQQETAPAQPSLDALRSGTAVPTQEQMGHRVDLPDAMREKMEDAFGADLSAVKLYESEAVADAGANAVTRGADIAFAPGLLDFTSFGGQALLGHEISHVVSQARGEVTGGGFLNDHALEARADMEGAMAAAGETVAMPTAAMSGVTAGAAAGPMQADKAADKVNSAQDEQVDLITSMVDMRKANPQGFQDDKAYLAAQKSLGKAQAKESKWRRRLSGDEKISSTGMKMLDHLKGRKRGASYASGDYFDEADAAMSIMGYDDDHENDEMMQRLFFDATMVGEEDKMDSISVSQSPVFKDMGSMSDLMAGYTAAYGRRGNTATSMSGTGAANDMARRKSRQEKALSFLDRHHLYH